MTKTKKSSELLWVFGTVFVALGVAVCSKANLGVSMIAAPAFVIYDAIKGVWSGFSVGMTEYIFQGVLLILMCILVRRFTWKYLLAFFVAVLYGFTLDFFLFVFSGVSFDTVWLRWLMLIIGDVCTAFGVACFFRTYLPLQVYELFVAEVSAKFNLNINKTKWCFDISLLVISVSLALILFAGKDKFDFSTVGYNSFHNIGLGTLVTTAINSPIITCWGKLIDKVFGKEAFFPKLERILKR